MRCVDADLKSGFEVNAVFDGDTHHSAKRASYTRTFEREKHRIKSIDLERKLTISLQDGSAKEISNGISIQLQKSRKANSLLPPTFSQHLHNVIIQYDDPALHYIVSEYFQVDPIIAKRSVDGLLHVIWSSNSDFVVHNPNALLIKDIKYARLSHTPYDIVLWAGDSVIVDKIMIMLK